MRITIELEPNDLERFDAALARAHRLAACADECDVVEAAKQALDGLPIASAPSFVRKRLAQVQRLILMLEDEQWALPQRERGDVVEALIYFSDPDDLIPDTVEVIGLLDDAIMLELLLRRQHRMLASYDSFCAFRERLGPVPRESAARVAHAGRLARKRESLQARMRQPSRSRARKTPTRARPMRIS